MTRRSQLCVPTLSALLFIAACNGNIPPEQTYLPPASGGSTNTAGAGGATAGAAGSLPGAGTGGTVPSGGTGAAPGIGGTAGTGPAGGTGGGGPQTLNCPPRATNTVSCVIVQGYQLFVGKRVNGNLEPATPYKIKGISWSPTGIGQVNEGGYAGYYTEWRGQDVPHIQNLNANTVKTYDGFERNSNGIALLDDLYNRGIMVIMTVITYHGAGKTYLETVNYFKHHPAILMWAVGNEFNYNNMYGYDGVSYGAALGVINTAINDIHAADPDHPVAVGYGELPSAQQYAEIPNADVWSLNIYPGLDFGGRFNAWMNRAPKPMFVGEYGADAWNGPPPNINAGAEDQAAQAEAIQKLTEQIMQWYSANDASLPVLGGTPYSLTDEWWKAKGSASEHDLGGFENAIHPDGFANEEWWGLLTIQRDTRLAYGTLKNLYAQP